MGLPCINSIAADEYAYQQGKEAERETWEKEKRAEIVKCLNDGESVWTGRASYNRWEILYENLMKEKAEAILLDAAMRTGSKTDWDLFIGRCDEVLEQWVTDNLADILAAEYEGAA